MRTVKTVHDVVGAELAYADFLLAWVLTHHATFSLAKRIGLVGMAWQRGQVRGANCHTGGQIRV